MVDFNDPNQINNAQKQLSELLKVISDSFDKAAQSSQKLGADTAKNLEAVFLSVRKAEEQYHKYSEAAEGDRTKSILANKNSIINKIKQQYSQETRAILSGKNLSGTIEETLFKKRLEYVQRLKRAEEEAVKSINKEKLLAGEKKSKLISPESTRSAVGSEVRSRILGAVGANVPALSGIAGAGKMTGIGVLFAALGKLTSSLFDMGKVATSTEAAFRTAGVSGLSFSDSTVRSFKELQDKTPLLRSELGELFQTIATSPALLQAVRADGGAAVTDFVAEMGALGISIEDSGKIAAESMISWGTATQDLTDSMKLARTLTKDTGVNARSAFNSILSLMNPLKNMTFSAEKAVLASQQMAGSLALTLGKSGLQFSQQEIQRTTQAMGDFLGGMRSDQWAGILSFTRGTMPDFKEVLETVQDPMKAFITYVDFAKKSLSEIPEAQRGFAVGALARQGLAAGIFDSPKMAQTFLEILEKNNVSQEEAIKAFESAQTTTDREQGFETLRNLQNPLENLNTSINKLIQALTGLNPLIEGVRGINTAVTAASSLAGRQTMLQGAQIGLAALNPLTSAMALAGYMGNTDKNVSKKPR